MTIQILKRRFVDVGLPQDRIVAKGRYQLRKLKNGIYTGEETPWFDNIILDSGLNRWGTGTIISGAAIGTGTATPASTDTGLQTQTHYTTTTGTGAGITAGGSSPYNNTRTFAYRTTLGALSGNYSEVGVGWASGSMFSRALILDGGGSPTTISVASDEQLDIVYQLSVYPPLTDTSTSVTISGVTHTITGRACNVNNVGGDYWALSQTAILLSSLGVGACTNGSIGAITGTPSGSTPGSGSLTTTSDTYINNSYQRTGNYAFGLTFGNLSGGISATIVTWSGKACFQYGLSPAIAKDATKTLILNFSVNWARR